MKKISIIILSTLASITLLGTAHAKPFNAEKRFEKISEKLSLTEVQQENFQTFLNEKKALREVRKSLREDGNKHSGEMKELFSKEQISVEEIYSAVDVKISNQRERRENMLKSFVVFYNSLEAEQREEIKPLIAKVLMGSMDRKGKGRHKR